MERANLEALQKKLFLVTHSGDSLFHQQCPSFPKCVSRSVGMKEARILQICRQKRKSPSG